MLGMRLTEILWLIANTVGLITTSYNLWDVLEDRRVLLRNGVSDERMTIVRTNIRQHAVALLAMIVFILVGVAAILVSTMESTPTWFRMGARIGLIIGAVAITANSVFERLLRRRLLRALGDGTVDHDR